MNGYTLLLVLTTLAGTAVLFILAHHGPTGILRASGLRLLNWAERIDARWEVVRVQHDMRLQQIAGAGKPVALRKTA